MHRVWTKVVQVSNYKLSINNKRNTGGIQTMNEEEIRELAQQLHKAQIQEYPWVSADPEDAESYIRTYGDTNVHLYYDYLLANNIGEVEE